MRAIERLEKHVEYYALDLSLAELSRTLSAIPKDAYRYVECFGLLGTYEDGLIWLQSPSPHTSSRTKVVMSLGSSIGNFTHDQAAGFVRGFANALGPDDMMLIGVDECKDSERVFRAYNDSQGATHRFTLNGLAHANKLLGISAFDLKQWNAHGTYDPAAGAHRAYVSPIRSVEICGVVIREGEKIRIEESYKFDRQEIRQLWQHAGVGLVAAWANGEGDYSKLELYSDVIRLDTPASRP